MNIAGPERRASSATRRAFTLIEVLVSMAVLALIMGILVQLIQATQQTWTYTVGKVEQFRDAREAFESLTRHLSEATLNTYWDYGYTGTQTPAVPTSYIRQSELRFISGNTTVLGVPPSGIAANASGTALRPTQAVFFQAPLGVVTDTTDYHGLDNLLNTWGYCIEFGSDSASRPPFLAKLTNPPPLRYRFRLLEFREPSESLSLYQKEAALNSGAASTGGNAAYTDKTWFTDALGTVGSPYETDGTTPRPVHVLADNVVALVILPKLTKEDETSTTGTAYTDASLSPYYLYDSTLTSNNTTAGAPSNVDPNLNPKNQLPAVMQVTLVAVDEASFNRLQGTSTQPQNFTEGLFQTVGDTANLHNAGYAQDLQTLQSHLQIVHLTYRVFTTSVIIKAAKWSRYQTN